MWHENLTDCPPHLSDVATLPWEIHKVIFNSIIHKYVWLFMLSYKKTNYNPFAHLTWKCHHNDLWIAKLFHLTEGLLRSFKRWMLLKKPVLSCRRWLRKERVVIYGNWNIRQAMLQQVFRVTTFCVNACFQSFSILISRIVHHDLLKFSPCRNKPLQASTCPYQCTRSSCSVPQAQYQGYADNRKH